MDGIHDLGGMHGFGKIERERNEPIFHEDWQKLAFAIMFGAQAIIRNHNADEYRHSVERLNPAFYLDSHYYDRMLSGTVTLLIEKGILELGDLEERAGGTFPLAQPIADQPIIDLESQPNPRFKVGDRVRVKQIYSKGHVRVPRYCRGKEGKVLHLAPKFTFPDTSAHGGIRRAEHTYHVEFSSQDLWPEQDNSNDYVVVDVWDSYLEKVGA